MSKNTIKIKKYSDVIEEYVAAAAITPGHLIEITSAGKVQKHSSAAGNVLPMFALEDEMQGNGIDTAYEAAAPVQCWIPYRGDMVYAQLKDGETAVIGSLLESAGNGELQVYAADSTGVYYPDQIVAVAVEAVDMSGSAGVDPSGRIIVRIV